MPHPIESTKDAQGARTAGAVAMRIKGLTGVFKKLVDEHKDMEDSLQRINASRSASQRRELWTVIRRQLLSHERGEVLEVYPALEGYDAVRDILERHSRHAEELEWAINELDAVGYDSEEWVPKFRDLVALAEDHMEDEESDFFPRAQEVLGERATEELEERFVSARREALNTLA
jgi:hypothetical protein